MSDFFIFLNMVYLNSDDANDLFTTGVRADKINEAKNGETTYSSCEDGKKAACCDPVCFCPLFDAEGWFFLFLFFFANY